MPWVCVEKRNSLDKAHYVIMTDTKELISLPKEGVVELLHKGINIQNLVLSANKRLLHKGDVNYLTPAKNIITMEENNIGNATYNSVHYWRDAEGTVWAGLPWHETNEMIYSQPTCEYPSTVTILPGTHGIENACFAASSITNVSLPNTLEQINSDAFKDCHKLMSVRIPDSVTEMGLFVFQGCISLRKAVLPRYITDIPDYTFMGCNKLMTVNMAPYVKTISAGAFHACQSLKGIVLPNTLTTIGELAFRGCTSLKEIHFPNSLKKINNNAFRHSGLTSVVIPPSVAVIGDGAFADCAQLSQVILPNRFLRNRWELDRIFPLCPNLKIKGL